MSIINRGDQIDKLVYENTTCNYFAIVGMLFLFWTIQMLHWFAVYSLGIHFSEILTIYSVIMFAVAITIIGCMLCLGSVVNSKKATHEYYAIKISEQKIQLKEVQKKKDEIEKAKKRKEDDAAQNTYGYAGYNP